MEDVLTVYSEPYDPQHPLVCMDESSKPLIGETRHPLPTEPGQPDCYDYEYERKGVANLFLFSEPLRGGRHVKVTDRRTKRDWAYAIKDWVDVYFPEAISIRLVMDNLNTHDLASLYDTFEPAEARRLVEKLEVHYTPKHGSWLNMAEIEFSVLNGQCLGRRISDHATLINEIAAWERDRNTAATGVNWHFTTADARIKLKRLYPSLQD